MATKMEHSSFDKPGWLAFHVFLTTEGVHRLQPIGKGLLHRQTPGHRPSDSQARICS
jgi:hypothetical protein